MSGYIDRNPQQMMKYAQDARAVISDMALIVRKVEGLLDAYARDLDDPTQKQIQKLHECCRAYFKEMETYQTVADTIFDKGKRLAAIREGGGKG